MVSEIFHIFAVTKNKFRMVYYKYLFKHGEDLSPNEGLVYSELLLNSLVSNEQYRTGELLYIDAAKEVMKNYKLLGWNQDIDYYPMDVKTLMKHTELTFPTVTKVLGSLQNKGYISQGSIKCSLDIVDAGYIKIPYKTGLKGRQLLFYAFLLDRGKGHSGTVDTWAYRFKELCGIEEGHVYFMLNKLKKNGLVERLEDGRLKIFRPNKKGKAIAASPIDKK